MSRDGICVDGEHFELDGQPPVAQQGNLRADYADIRPPWLPPA